MPTLWLKDSGELIYISLLQPTNAESLSKNGVDFKCNGQLTEILESRGKQPRSSSLKVFQCASNISE